MDSDKKEEKKVSIDVDLTLDSDTSLSEKSSSKKKPRFSIFDAYDNMYSKSRENEENSDLKTSAVKKINSISRTMACLFIIGNSLGSFIFELPHALKGSGWFGVFLIVTCIVNTVYSGIIQGRCWIMMEECWSEYKDVCHRSPFPEIGYRVGGNCMKYIMTVFLIINQATGFILKMILLAKFIDRALFSSIGFCPTFLLITLLLIPFLFLGSPKDYKFLGILSAFTSVVAVLLLTVAIVIDKNEVKRVTYVKSGIDQLAMSMGTILVAVNPRLVFPTIQQDMEDRPGFPKTVFTANLVILYLFLFFPILGYAAYGDTTPYDILIKLKPKSHLNIIVFVTEVLLCCEMFASNILQLNPVSLCLEHLLDIPAHFTYKRVLLRTGVTTVLFLVIFNGTYLTEVLPFSEAILGNFTVYLLPGLFYVILSYRTQIKNKGISKKEWFFVIEMAVFGVVAMFGSYLTADFHLRVKKQFGFNCYNSDHFINYNFTNHI